jgi:Na+/proline symporter
MLKILQVTLGLDAASALWALLALLIFTGVLHDARGLWGVLVTDLVQFVLKMGMVVALAYFAVRATGGLTALEGKVRALDAAAGGGSRLAFFPSTDSAWMPAITLFVYLGVSWWASWYPGAEPGGGGYVAQRIFSAKTERDGLFATLWFNIAHYAVRPWPWILTALASLVLYPNLVDKESGYVRTLMDPTCFRRRCAASCSPRSPPPTCRRSALSSIGAPPTSSTTSTAGFSGATPEREYVVVSQA